LTWLDKSIIERLCQRSCGFIFQTEDKVRIEQLINSARQCNLSKAFKANYASILEYNILRRELKELKPTSETILAPEPGKSYLQIIDERLHQTASRTDQPQGALVIIHWVLTKAHADNIADMLASWSQDKTMYKTTSTVFVFTSDEGLFSETVRRLCYTTEIEPGSDAEYRDVLDTLAAKMKPALKLNVTEQFVQAPRGLTLHQTETAALKGIYTNPERQLSLPPFTDLKIQILRSSGLEFITPSFGYEAIGGFESIKQEFADFVVAPLQDPAKALYYGLGSPRGIIEYGPPGVGKTVFAIATAKALELPMVKLTPADLYRSLVGESESRVKHLTELIESLSPIVVFIDEVDQLFIARNQVMMTDSGVNRRILNGLLDWLGQPSRRSFVIGATNCIEQMDEAATRAGRFDEILFIPYPNRKAREDIFKIQCTMTHKIPVAKELSYKELAAESQLLSGAEIEKWCILASRAAMRHGDKYVTQDHFKDTVSQIVIDPKKRWDDLQVQVKRLRTMSNVNVPLLEESLQEFYDSEKEVGDERTSSFLKIIGENGTEGTAL